MQHVQRIEIAGDGLGALDMKDGRETAGLDRTADIGSIAADGNAAFGTLFDVEEQPRMASVSFSASGCDGVG